MVSQTLRNDRDVIIAIVAEHIIFDDKYLRRATIKSLDDPERGMDVIIQHNQNWVFAYDSRKNIIYWRPH